MRQYKIVISLALAAFTHVGMFANEDAGEAITEHSHEDFLPLDHHALVTKAIDGSLIEIEDQSKWSVLPYYQDIVAEWERSDTLMIYINTGFFRTGKFIVHNKRTSENIEADINTPPLRCHEHFKRIIAIDTRTGEILLENGNGYRSVWKVTDGDLSQIDGWKVNHAIIVGSNTPSWFWTDDADCVLINYEKDTYVRVSELQ